MKHKNSNSDITRGTPFCKCGASMICLDGINFKCPVCENKNSNNPQENNSPSEVGSVMASHPVDNLSTLISKIEKGCGNVFNQTGIATKGLFKGSKISSDFNCIQDDLCPTCQATLSALLQARKIVGDEIEKIKDKWQEKIQEFPECVSPKLNEQVGK